MQQNSPYLAAILALIAGLLPAIYKELNLEAHTAEISSQAGQYKDLENRFRQAAENHFLGRLEPLKTEFNVLMRQMEALRAKPLMLPPRFFAQAREHIKGGYYKPDKQTLASAACQATGRTAAVCGAYALHPVASPSRKGQKKAETGVVVSS